jgi:hypothetical protein
MRLASAAGVENSRLHGCALIAVEAHFHDLNPRLRHALALDQFGDHEVPDGLLLGTPAACEHCHQGSQTETESFSHMRSGLATMTTCMSLANLTIL